MAGIAGKYTHRAFTLTKAESGNTARELPYLNRNPITQLQPLETSYLILGGKKKKRSHACEGHSTRTQTH